MKKYLNLSLAYAVAAMAGGVFYREFTKLNGFVGVTALARCTPICSCWARWCSCWWRCSRRRATS